MNLRNELSEFRNDGRFALLDTIKSSIAHMLSEQPFLDVWSNLIEELLGKWLYLRLHWGKTNKDFVHDNAEAPF